MRTLSLSLSLCLSLSSISLFILLFCLFFFSGKKSTVTFFLTKGNRVKNFNQVLVFGKQTYTKEAASTVFKIFCSITPQENTWTTRNKDSTKIYTTLAKKIETGTQAKHRRVHA